MFYVEVIGYIGCLFLFMSFIPQTYKLIYHGPIETISPLFLCFILCASLFLGIYAFYINAYPILLANISVFLNILNNISQPDRTCSIENNNLQHCLKQAEDFLFFRIFNNNFIAPS